MVQKEMKQSMHSDDLNDGKRNTAVQVRARNDAETMRLKMWSRALVLLSSTIRKVDTIRAANCKYHCRSIAPPSTHIPAAYAIINGSE